MPLDQLDEKEVANALRELEALEKLSHPNIVSCLGGWVASGGETMLRPWSAGNEMARKPISEALSVWAAASGATEPASLNLLTEYMDGGSLDKLLTRNKEPLEEELVGTWAAQVVLALDHMHKRNLLHRDIKPANIFIMQSGLVKLGDLGCCQMLTRPDETVTSDYGSPLYLSPEIWQTGTCDHKSDIWSLGCVIYELLAHKPPFNAPELAYKVLTASPEELPSAYSADVRGVTMCMLHKDPKKRPGATELIRHPTIAHYITFWLQASLTPLGDGKAAGHGITGSSLRAGVLAGASKSGRVLRMISGGVLGRSQKK